MDIILFIIILAVLVLVHEFGHFYAAKKSGVRVDEFGLGFPPRLWGKKVGETLYSFNAIPFGGFVRIFGESYESEGETNGTEAVPDSRSFIKKPRIVQVIILLAGIFMNIIFAWLLFSIAYMSGMTTGISEENSAYVRDAHVIVLDVLPNSPAEKGGLREGDQILSYRAGGATTTVSVPSHVQGITRNSGGRPITFEVLRVKNVEYIKVIPEKSDLDGNYVAGISMDIVGKANMPFYMAFVEGAKLTWNIFKSIFVGIYHLIGNALIGQADISQLSGPVGIARLVGDASHLGLAYLLSFTAFISLNLAVLNLIPFPALDGGRVLFVIIEAIRRKSIKPVVANTVNVIGFGLLIVFMLFITYRDIAKLL